MKVYKKYLNINILVCILIIYSCIITKDVFSQGGMFVRYIPIDSLSPILIEKEIRIDFRGSEKETFNPSIKGFKLFLNEDTIFLFIESNRVVYKENWNINVDYFSLRDQFLESIDLDTAKRTIIREIYLKSYDEKYLYVEISIYHSNIIYKKIIGVKKDEIIGLLIHKE